MSLTYEPSNELGIEEQIVVLPCDGQRPWNAKRLKPALDFTLADGTSFDRMFRSFIFMCVEIDGKSMHPLANPFGAVANLETWEKWIDELFTSAANFDALARAASDSVDVWVSLPYPRRGQSFVGDLNGTTLNFSEDRDRLLALTWWMNKFLERWNQSTKFHDKLNLRGFVWLREVILPEEDRGLVTSVNEEIHARNLLSFWLPNYGSHVFWEWRQMGFDVAAVNPNYYGAGPYGIDWVKWTAMGARLYETGLQIPCGRGLLYGDTHLIDYFNLGLAQYSDYMASTVIVYRFTNYSIRAMYRKDFESYRRLYTFVRGIYRKTRYKGMEY